MSRHPLPDGEDPMSVLPPAEMDPCGECPKGTCDDCEWCVYFRADFPSPGVVAAITGVSP